VGLNLELSIAELQAVQIWIQILKLRFISFGHVKAGAIKIKVSYRSLTILFTTALHCKCCPHLIAEGLYFSITACGMLH